MDARLNFKTAAYEPTQSIAIAMSRWTEWGYSFCGGHFHHQNRLACIEIFRSAGGLQFADPLRVRAGL